jgi:RsiW-degrading membrane proteinase PrsW (M82 family)
MSFEPIIIILIAPLIASFYLAVGRKHSDRHSYLLLRDSLLYGIIAFVVAIILIAVMESDGLATIRSLKRTLFYAFVVVGFLEELPKLLIFVIFLNKKETFDSPTKGILFGISIALGFVLAKNAYFVLTNGGGHFTEASGFFSVPAHLLIAIIMGFFISYGKFTGSRFIYPMLALGSASFFHGLYQFALFSEDNTLLMVFFGVALLIAVMLFRKAMNTTREDIDHIDHQKIRKELRGSPGDQ